MKNLMSNPSLPDHRSHSACPCGETTRNAPHSFHAPGWFAIGSGDVGAGNGPEMAVSPVPAISKGQWGGKDGSPMECLGRLKDLQAGARTWNRDRFWWFWVPCSSSRRIRPDRRGGFPVPASCDAKKRRRRTNALLALLLPDAPWDC